MPYRFCLSMSLSVVLHAAALNGLFDIGLGTQVSVSQVLPAPPITASILPTGPLNQAAKRTSARAITKQTPIRRKALRAPAAAASALVPITRQKTIDGAKTNSDAPEIGSTFTGDPATHVTKRSPGKMGTSVSSPKPLVILTESYLAELLAAIAAQKFYPEKARRTGVQGRVVVRVTVRPDGRITEVTVAKRSGTRLLDRAAKTAVRRLGRFRPFYPQIAQRSLTTEVTFNYRLEG